MRRAASLFCGAGGACLGLRQAGFDIVAGVDFNEPALATYAAAGGHLVQHRITESEPVPAAWVAPLMGLDLLWASPPCQPWSRAGKMKGAEDERDAWPATIAAVALLRPQWFIAENVPGVEVHLDQYVVPALQALGRVVSRRILNAADYGVPQIRKRVFIVAGPAEMVWPTPTHRDQRTSLLPFDSLKPWRSMGGALGIDGHVKHDRGRGIPERHGARPSRSTDLPAPTIAAGSKGSGPYLTYTPKHSDQCPCRASPGGECEAKSRRLRPDECAILQDFPPDYPWRGGATVRFAQAGNACPPTLARVLAESIKNLYAQH